MSGGDFAEDEAATSVLFRHVLREYARAISREEKKLVDDFAERTRDQNLGGISTLSIQQQGHSRKLGPEIKRLLFLKHHIRKYLKYTDRIYYDDSDESEVLLHELLERHQKRVARGELAAEEEGVADETDTRPCTDRSHMDLIERECPLLCAKGSAFRTKIAKGLLEKNVEPKMVIMEIELLGMVEDGELQSDEASIVLSKILMDPAQFHARLRAACGPPAGVVPAPAAAPSAAYPEPQSQQQLLRQQRRLKMAQQHQPATARSQLSFSEYCAKRDDVRKKIMRQQTDA